VLGSLSDIINEERTDLLFVINTKRPFAEDSENVIKK